MVGRRSRFDYVADLAGPGGRCLGRPSQGAMRRPHGNSPSSRHWRLPAGCLIVLFLIAGVLIKIGFVSWAVVIMLGLYLLDIGCKMKLVLRRNSHASQRE